MFCILPSKELLLIKGISDAKVGIEAATKLVPFSSASQFHAQRQEIIRITSESRELDKVLEASTGSRGW